MKTGVIGFCSTACLVLLASFPNIMAADADAVIPNGTAPATIDTIKKKIEAINNAQTTSGLAEVIRLYQAGVDKGVIETYVRNSRIPGPTPKDLIYLHEQGVPEEIVKALIDHGRELQQSAQVNTTQPTPNNQNQPIVVSPTNPGTTYNSFVYNGAARGSTPTENAAYTGGRNSSVTIIPYNPYRNLYQSYYSAPFYSDYWYSPYSPYGYGWGGWYGGYGYGGYGSYNECSPYRFGVGPSYIYNHPPLLGYRPYYRPPLVIGRGYSQHHHFGWRR